MVGRRAPVTVVVGPATVRRAGATDPGDDREARAALDGIDDPVIPCDGGPVDVDRLWAAVLAAALAGAPGGGRAVQLLHPSGWTPRQVGRVRAAAAGLCDSVVIRPRYDLIAEHLGAGVTVVEAGGGLVTVAGGGDPVTVFADHDTAAVAADVRARAAPGTDVVLDAPAGLSDGLRNLLVDNGIEVRDIDVEDLLGGDPGGAAVSPVRPRRRCAPPASRRRLAAAAVVAVVAVAVVVAAVIGTGAGHPRDNAGSQPAAPAAVTLIEGRVAVRIPPRWTVQRVTEGPGSRRVQITSPSEATTALHVTQSYAPQTTLEETAAVLTRAMAGQPPGVFTTPSIAQVPGHPVVTYLESRPGRAIRWSVLIDGVTRIAIGCQSVPDRPESVRAACDDALASARQADTPERQGTPAPR